jgi:hypothetical protein
MGSVIVSSAGYQSEIRRLRLQIPQIDPPRLAPTGRHFAHGSFQLRQSEALEEAFALFLRPLLLLGLEAIAGVAPAPQRIFRRPGAKLLAREQARGAAGCHVGLCLQQSVARLWRHLGIEQRPRLHLRLRGLRLGLRLPAKNAQKDKDARWTKRKRPPASKRDRS